MPCPLHTTPLLARRQTDASTVHTSPKVALVGPHTPSTHAKSRPAATKTFVRSGPATTAAPTRGAHGASKPDCHGPAAVRAVAYVFVEYAETELS